MGKSGATYRGAVSASAPKAKLSHPAGKLKSLSVRMADNGGFIASSSHDTGKDKSGYPMYQEPKEHAFADRKALNAWLDGMLGEKD